MDESPSAKGRASTGAPGHAVTVPPRALLRVKKIWIMPMALSGVLITLISLIYVGSVVNPTGHLRGLPVLIVNEDKPVQIAGQSVNIGARVETGLFGSSKVISRLALKSMSLTAAKHRMDSGARTRRLSSRRVSAPQRRVSTVCPRLRPAQAYQPSRS